MLKKKTVVKLFWKTLELRKEYEYSQMSTGTSLRSDGLDLTFWCWGVGSVPGWGARIPQALQPRNQDIEGKQYSTKLSKGFKISPCQKKV